MPATTYKNLMERMFFDEGRPFSKDNAAKNTAHKETDSRKKQADQMGLVWVGGAYYAPAEGKPATHKSDGAKIVPLTPDEKKAVAKATPAKKQSAGSPSKKISTGKPAAGEPTKSKTISVDRFSEIMQSRLTAALHKLSNSASLHALRDEFAPDLKKFYNRLDDISKLPKGKKRREHLEKFIEDFNIKMGNKKLYANHFKNTGGLYKVFGDTIASDGKYFLDLLASEGLDLDDSTNSKQSAKHYLAGQSKPNFGKPFNLNDPTVSVVFGSNKVLDSLDLRYKSLYGPSGPDGTLARAGGKNAKLHFAHSVNSNVGVSRVIEATAQLAEKSGQSPKDTTSYAGVANALRSYQRRMQAALKNFDAVPPKARRELVGQIYSQLAYDMFTADKEVAASIMKNMAEIALYDTEIAGGDEAYLPSDGSFPSGDKIVVTRKGAKVEKIESVSIKFGENSDGTYGMPGEASKILLYHPDPRYRDLLDNRAGRAGYELGVRGDVIHDEGTFRKMCADSGFTKCFDKDTLNKIRELGVEMTMITKSFKRNHPLNKNGELTGEQLGGIQNDVKMQNAWQKLYTLLNKGDKEQLIELMGEKNYKRMVKPNQQSMNFYSLIAFGSALRTSDGFPTLLHNHQVYKKGEFISHTSEGTGNMRDWGMDSIFYGKRAGGMKAGFIGAH
jgi:hypothetical protein